MAATTGAPATAAAMRDKGMMPVKTPRIRRSGITPVFSLRWRRSTSRFVSGRSAMGASGDAELEIEAESNAADGEGIAASRAVGTGTAWLPEVSGVGSCRPHRWQNENSITFQVPQNGQGLRPAGGAD